MVSVVGADGGVARSRESWSLAPHRARRGGHADLGGKDLVDDAVVLGLLGGHEEVAVAVVLDLLDGLARVVGDVLAEQGADEEDLLGLDLNVRRLQ